MTFVRQVEADTELTIEEVKVLAEDRKAWRLLTGRGNTTPT